MTQGAKKSKVWIVEMFSEIMRRFEPTVGCRLTREEGRIELEIWRGKNPSERFRLSPYLRKPR